MLNYIWAFMILVGIAYASLTGNIEAVSSAALDSAKEAVTLCITMLGIMSMWTGLMEIARSSGMIEAAVRKCDPLLHFLFPRIAKTHPARGYIATNMIAKDGWIIGLKILYFKLVHQPYHGGYLCFLFFADRGCLF